MARLRNSSYVLKAALSLIVVLLTLGSCRSERLSISISLDTQVVELNFNNSPSQGGRSQERSIQLAPGNTYTLSCGETDIGLGGVPWSTGGVAVPTSPSAGTYATTPDSNRWDLVISSFSVGDVGRYSCAGSEETLTLDISMANPALIADSPYLPIQSGFTGSSTRLTLTAFYSGNPEPQLSDSTWMYNNTMSYPDGSFPAGIGSFLFPPVIALEQTGEYTLTITTSAGTATAEFEVQVIIDPDVLISTGAEVTLFQGEPFEVICADMSGVPRPTFKWRLNGSIPLQSGGNVNITDISNSTHAISRLRLLSVTPDDNGEYECLARNFPDSNMYMGETVAINVLEPPLPPTGITASTLSDCTIRIDWTIPTALGNTANTDSFIFEIQFIVNGAAEAWAELDTSPAPPLVAMVESRGINTTYYLRGRGFNASIESRVNSDAVGTFSSYQDRDFPRITSISGRPVGSNAVSVTWSIADSMCYEYTNFSVSCQLPSDDSVVVVVDVVPERGELSDAATVAGLQEADALYDCHVLGTFSESGGTRIIMEQGQSGIVRTFTFPSPPPTPAEPAVDENTITVDRFTVTFQQLLAVENIGHYQIIVLRLSSQAVPTSHPDQLYTDNSTFSDCQAVNDLDNKATTFPPYVAAEMSPDEFMAKFVVGGGASVELEGRCNDKVLPGVTYTVFLRAFPRSSYDQGSLGTGGRRRRQVTTPRQYAVFSSSGFLPPVTTKFASPPTGESRTPPNEVTIIVVCIIVVGLFIAAVLTVSIIGICFYRKTHSKSLTFSPSVDNSIGSSSCDLANYPDTPDLGQRKNGLEMKEMEAFADPLDKPFQPSGAVRGEDFAAHVEKFDAKRQLLFQEEFEWITKKSPWHPAEASNDPRNDHKNRYSNITAFDHSCVKLKTKPGLECSDYINANYIAGFSKPRQYIATQGPLDQTVEDFWRMMWEQRSATIIMLTNVVELGKIKCSQYWPTSSKTMYGDIAVTLESTHLFPDYTIRTLSVQLASTNEQRRVLQFHYTKWPDYGTPKLAAPLLNFLKIVHEANDTEENAGPLVVHCSAGVGRSGTVLTIDYCLQQLRQENMVNICGFVRNMREQRNYMVQTDQQYTFIHYAILEAITYGDTSYDVQEFMKSYSKLQSASLSSSPDQALAMEFERLGAVKTMVKKSSFQNRIKVKGAPQRHFHSSFHGGSASGSLQQCLGHFLDGYNQSNLFVVTEGPDDLTANRFWEMIWDHNCGYIIMLTPLDADELFCYWPESGEAEVQFGSIRVMVETESAEHLYTSRTIRLTNTKVEGISHHVIQYQFIGWTAQFLPRVPDFVTFVCDVLKNVDTTDRSNRVMVHDTSSLGPSGIFCSLFYSIQRLQTEKMVDIFQAVQMTQLQRPGCVSEVSEYAFLYDCVHEFLMKNS